MCAQNLNKQENEMTTKIKMKTETMQGKPTLDCLTDMIAEKVARIIENRNPVSKRFLSVEEAEEYTDLSHSTLRLRVREGKLNKTKSGGRVYYEREDLDRMILGEITVTRRTETDDHGIESMRERNRA